MRFVIKGPPRTAKNHQRIVTNKKTGKPFVIASSQATGWGKQALAQLTEQRRVQGPAGFRSLGPYVDFPLRHPVRVRALVYRDRRVGDLDNYLHAVGDALQKAGVILNDRQIESWDGSRKLIDRESPRVEIEIEPMSGGP